MKGNDRVATVAAMTPELPQPDTVKILLVDDKAENLVALEAVLDGLGQQLIKAQSGKEALRACLEHDFAAILLDVKMPDMDGFETAAMIREREQSKDTPIIFLTALKSEEHLFRGYYMGAVDYLYKPIVPEVLRSKVAVFVDLSRKNAILKRNSDTLAQKNEQLRQEISERMRAEADARSLNEKLELRVEERTRELSRMNEELRQFAYVASHDLQEPLRTVASYAQLLARRYHGKLDKDADEFIEYMVGGVTRMHTLLNDMLAYSRVTESKDRPLVPANLDSVVQSALMNLTLTIKENHAEIVKGPLPVVPGDEIQLTQVFQNLIGNAIKYKSDAPPKIEISAQETPDEWIISVADNGIGIDPQYSERIFGIFKRLHGRELPGTGMGLAICKRIVERHNGRIWVEPQVGGGSKFSFSLPF
ncbi:MAG TPA: ATP-binding protein [Bryobacteraceae bacterium]|nr:ATP-binding protein [Bryobacteraceae bacterium]